MQTGTPRLTTWIIIVVSALSLISTQVVFAQPEPKNPAPPSEREFKPDPNSPLTLPNVRVRTFKDPKLGEVLHMQGWEHGSGELGEEGYSIEVDEEKGTYKVTPVDPALVQPPEFQQKLQQPMPWTMKPRPQSHRFPGFAPPSLERASFVPVVGN